VARPRQRSRLGSDSGEGRCNAGEQAALGALLEHRKGARGLGRRWKRAEVRVHRSGDNGGPVGRCACTGMVELPFIGAGKAMGACEHRLEGREEEGRHATVEVCRTSPTGGAAGGPAKAQAGGHTWV
jgi:hypothetical protein